MKFESYLWIPSKAAYVRGDEKPNVACILCSIRERDPRVKSLEVWRGGGNIAVLNLYPYNAGHMLVFPARHVEELSEITSSEVASLFDAVNLAIRVLKKKYSPRGFNVGFNIGEVSGASIPHLHAHVVPRYGHELGFIDIVGASKVLIDNPETYVEDLKKEFGTIGRDTG